MSGTSSRNLLLTPGPTPVPAAVAAAGAAPIPHHRSAEFTEQFQRVLDGLKRVYRTTNDVVLYASSGTAAFESAYANLLSPGDRVLVATAGNFGDRWVKMAEAFGAEVEALRFPWGTRPDAAQIAERIVGRDDLAVAVVVHSETSTGSVLDLEAVTRLTRGRSAVLVVDAISSLGATPLATDLWDIDVVIAGSQKALMCPPGLAFASVSGRALERTRTARTPRFSLDWARAIDAQRKGQSPFTPPISLIAQLDVALQMILAEGLEARFARTRAMGAGMRAATRALGLELYSPDHASCSLVTAISWPAAIDGEAIRKRLRSEHGITAAGGQGEAKGRIIRFGAFGAIEAQDLVTGLAALEIELVEAGHVVELGTGVGAFLRTYVEADRG
jgi:aspartate aminotransferase-like enzyme